MSAHISESRLTNLRKMAEAVTERWPSRNVSAEDLGLEFFCGAEPRRAVANSEPAKVQGERSGSSVGRATLARASAGSSPAHSSPEMVTAPTHFEFNEVEDADGPDAYDLEVESEMVREARDVHPHD